MAKTWKVAIHKDTSKPMLGLHGLHNAFRGLPNVDVVAQVDSNADNMAVKLEASGARRLYSNFVEMLEKERPDIVVLCSRHPADHLPQIRTAVEYGAHIYCEKPLSAKLEEIDEIIRIVDKARLKLCMAHPCRYDANFLALKRLVEEGEIGTPLTVYGRGKCDHRGGGEDMIVLGTHILDYQAFLFGAPCRVWADVRSEGRPVTRRDRSKTVEPIGPAAGDDLFACFNFPCGVRGIFESKRGLPGVAEGVVQMGVTVVGTKGALAMRFNDAAAPICRLRRCRKPGPPEDEIAFEDVPVVETRVIPGALPIDYSRCGTLDIPHARFFLETNRFAVWDLMQAIEQDRAPVSNGNHARVTAEMICGVYASGLSGKAVDLPLFRRTHPLEG